jgi:hypothetical protein
VERVEQRRSTPPAATRTERFQQQLTERGVVVSLVVVGARRPRPELRPMFVPRPVKIVDRRAKHIPSAVAKNLRQLIAKGRLPRRGPPIDPDPHRTTNID